MTPTMRRSSGSRPLSRWRRRNTVRLSWRGAPRTSRPAPRHCVPECRLGPEPFRIRSRADERSANAALLISSARCSTGEHPKRKGRSMTVTSSNTMFDELAQSVRGDVITAADPRYDAARAVYNAMIDKHPGAIVCVADTADVVTAVRFARAHGLEIAVRGGGHNSGGLGVADDALVVDFSAMKSTTVDPAAHTVRVDPGCTWADVDHATVAFGMATPSGFIGSTGVAGLTLGGGIGYLARRFGLTVDNLLSADVVLADGTFVTASESSHSDLFWALRGGGGNFGIVTSFTFRCHDIGEHGTVIAGPVLYDFADTAEVMRWYRELLPSLPEELSGWIGLMTIPPAPPFPEELWGRKACAIVWCYTGTDERADAVLEPVKTYGSPLLVGLQAMPFDVLQSAFDALSPPRLQWYWQTDIFNAISDAAIDVHVKYGAKLPTGHSTMHLYPIDGAA